MIIKYKDIDLNEGISGIAFATSFIDGEGTFEVSFFDGSISRMDNFYLLQGEISSKMYCKCDRCLADMSLELKSSIYLTLCPTGTLQGVAGEYELSDADTDSYYTAKDYVDLIDIIRQEIMLQIPLKKVCSTDCKVDCLVTDMDEYDSQVMHPLKDLLKLKEI